MDDVSWGYSGCCKVSKTISGPRYAAQRAPYSGNVSSVWLNGEPLPSPAVYLTELLRNEMGFDGVAVLGCTAISELYERHKVADSLAQAGYLSLSAGMDIELPNKNAAGDEFASIFAGVPRPNVSCKPNFLSVEQYLS
ncbi:MAG: hypothetical protein LBL09_02540 [Oscillospiraceae bacterium]|nr:hypothetical protein [Oscillospiraceae bacterium]